MPNMSASPPVRRPPSSTAPPPPDQRLPRLVAVRVLRAVLPRQELRKLSLPGGTGAYSPNRLNARRSAMTNSVVRIGGVEGDLVKRALAALAFFAPAAAARRLPAEAEPALRHVQSRRPRFLIASCPKHENLCRFWQPAGLLKMADRADWRNCTYSKEEETKMGSDFKSEFQEFDPTK